MADFGGDVETFRAEAKDWLAANFPPSLKNEEVAMAAAVGPLQGDAKLWRDRMGEKGWGTPTWPKAVRRRRADLRPKPASSSPK